MRVWLSASVVVLVFVLVLVLVLEVVQVLYEPAALCSESLETLEKSIEELVWRCFSLMREAHFQKKYCFP